MEQGIEAKGERPIRYYPRTAAGSGGGGAERTPPNSQYPEDAPNTPPMITFVVGDSQLRGPANRQNLRRIRSWVDELEAKLAS